MAYEHMHMCNACKQEKLHSNHSATTCIDCLASGVKFCAGCGRVLPIATFVKKGKNGRGSDCLECHRNTNKNPVYNQQRRERYSRLKTESAFVTKKNEANKKHYKTSEAPSATAAYWAARNHSRRAQLAGYFTPQEWQRCLEYFEHSCCYCGEPVPLTVEHLIAVSRGGTNTVQNIAPACKHCNYSKGDRPLLEWYPAQPFYAAVRLVRINSWFKEGYACMS